MSDVFYISTAIDYTNGSPHIGHAYEKVLADVIARYQRLKGKEVYFLTGVDQHGQKVQQSAEKEGVHPATFVKKLTKKFVKLWDLLEVDYDGWAETIDERHKLCVQKILTQLHEQGQIYKKAYKGHYSVRQEQFLTDRERNEAGEFGPEWGEVVELEEENYYFRLSEHATWLKDFVENSDDFIIPSLRKSEVLNVLDRAGENDLCISRPKARLRWGIEFPFDPEFVTYVWFDALINYISFAGYQASEEADLPEFEKLWPAQLHVIGKDIMVPAHAVYWPTMLHAMGFTDEQIPSLLVHGWWNLKSKDGGTEKMSKSLGNVVDPVELAEKFGVDAVRYYLVRDIHTGKDSDFDVERLVMLFNTELANNLGNLCNRALNMTKRFLGGELVAGEFEDESCAALRAKLPECLERYTTAMDSYKVSDALAAVIEYITAANIFAEQHRPWELAKDEEQKERLASVLNHMAAVTAHATVLLNPIVPTACERLRAQLQAPHLADLKLADLKWDILPVGHATAKPKPVFPRIQLDKEEG